MDKKIYFVSWKKHKVEQALTQTEAICDSFISDLIFETIIDYFREKFGYPGALPICSITQNEPIIPQPLGEPIQSKLDITDIRRFQRCPICGEQVDGPRFTSHLEEGCFNNEKDKIAKLQLYFDNECNTDKGNDSNDN